jgi:hypothetical protein
LALARSRVKRETVDFFSHTELKGKNLLFWQCQTSSDENHQPAMK